MIEAIIIALSIGGIITHAFELSLEQLIGVHILFVLCSLIYFHKNKRAAIILAIASAVGAFHLYIYQQENVTKYHATVVIGMVQKVDKRLEGIVFTVKDQSTKGIFQIKSTQDNVFPGDIIIAMGRSFPFENFDTDSGRMFNYKKFMHGKGIDAGFIADNVAVIQNQQSINRISFIIQQNVARIYEKHIAHPIGGIISGMLIGYQGGLPEEIKTLFKDTGVLHVLVLSGFNITLMVGIVLVVLKPFPVFVRNVAAVFFVIALVFISGAGVASIRAGLMGIIGIFADVAKKQYDALRALGLVYTCFFFISPYTVFYDPGFHLSFIATFFMIVFASKAANTFSFLPVYKYCNVQEIVSLAVCMPAFMIPYTMYFSGVFPISGIFANIAIAVIMPLFLIFGLMLLCFSFVLPIAHVSGALLSFAGDVTIRILETLRELYIWQTPNIPWWGMLCAYGVMVFLFFKREIAMHVLQLQNDPPQLSSSIG